MKQQKTGGRGRTCAAIVFSVLIAIGLRHEGDTPVLRQGNGDGPLGSILRSPREEFPLAGSEGRKRQNSKRHP